jgi:YbbR domain-containing protein
MPIKPDFSLFSKRWQLKLLSLLIGASLWYFVVGEDQVDITLAVPVELHNLSSELVIANQYKREIEVTIRGPKRLVREMRRQNISRPVDLSRAAPGSMVIENEPDSIPFPQGITVHRVQPTTITLLVDRLARREFVITPTTTGRPATGFTLDRIVLTPAKMTVSGPQSMLESETELTTHTIDLDGLNQTKKLQVHLQLSEPMLKLIGETVIEAEVVAKETMVTRTVHHIPINLKELPSGAKIQPTTVTVEAAIPQLVVQETPELAMLFRAVVNGAMVNTEGELPIVVNGISLPGHAPIVIQTVLPEKARLGP